MFQVVSQDSRSLSHRYYSLSVILGTIALSYGSVPMYKMVSILLPVERVLKLTVHIRYVNKPAGAASLLKLRFFPPARILLLDSSR